MANLSTEFGRADAVMLDEITEDAFLDNLKLRYEKDKIYTYIGEVLISMNPYKQLPIYSEDMVSTYHGTALYQREPHVFALAEAAYAGMRRSQSDCCILISGESGAGKTEASKSIMRYIAAVSVPSKRAEVDRVKDMLLASNPLLEAFGNAKTARNDNSSRFGKYMDINFDFKFEPVGGHINNYLLEKARVVRHAEADRNFHIFYQLLAGADAGLLASLDLTADTSKYNFLKMGKTQTMDSDKANYAELVAAMDAVGMSTETKDMLFKLVAAVLHLGQVEFEDQGEHCSIKTTGVLDSIGKLLGTDSATLSKALTFRVVAARGEIFESKLNHVKAGHGRDALSKAVYNELFTYLVAQVNESIKVKEGSSGTVIGVLDIYGFEIFPTNGFEQFCINYCNEKLQQLFIELVMKREQEEYASEGITWVEVPYFDNKGICDMVESHKDGVITILDDHCSRPDGSDEALLSHLTQALNPNERFSSFAKDPKSGCKRDVDFQIKHFAGDVVYTISGFVDKNNDTLFQDLKRMLYQCKMPALQTMFPGGADELTKVHKNPATAATNFKTSMLDLVDLLQNKNPYYVRCIKPNNNKAADLYDSELCSHQVRYLGLMENLRVRRAGYCNRQIYDIFVQRYKMLTKQTWPHYRGDQKKGAEIIIDALKLKEDVAFGKTKLFIKEPSTLYFIEEKREETIPLIVAKIQAFYRGMMARRYVKKLRACVKIAKWWRGLKANKYSAALTKAFTFPSADYCRGVQWPAPPSGISNAFEKLGRRVHQRWWTTTVLKKFSPEKKAEMELKMTAFTLLRGKFAWGVGTEWQGNYMKTHPNVEKYGKQITSLLTKSSDGSIVFAAAGVQTNAKKKEVPVVIVVTSKNMYVLDGKKFKLSSKTPYALDTTTNVSFSTPEVGTTITVTIGGTDVTARFPDAPVAELLTYIIKGAGKDVPVRFA